MRSLSLVTLMSVIATAAAPARQQPAHAPMVAAEPAAVSDCMGKRQDASAAMDATAGRPATQGASQCM